MSLLQEALAYKQIHSADQKVGAWSKLPSLPKLPKLPKFFSSKKKSRPTKKKADLRVRKVVKYIMTKQGSIQEVFDDNTLGNIITNQNAINKTLDIVPYNSDFKNR